MNWKELMYYFVCYIVIGIVWQSYEQIRYGELKPDVFDTLVACVLAYTIVMIWKIGVHWKSAEHELEQYGKAVVDLNDIILRQNKVIAEQNKTMLRLGTITARKKDIASEKMISTLEKYADPEYYSILNDRDVYEGDEGEELRPVGSLARQTIDRAKNMIRI
ncbi:hypothetical protein EVJ32_09560 [Exiguobacterium sp. SH5S4]|uniref:hypothetical protein n=1 Tax=Exiguobacterium sp. SH5S4 TaxID=2510961 RepID=UPI00103F79F8|nr:hypothetical protein [Exiguobacterium sp. SH5S4]TCI25561.1 hypothetical protein EVJ32_09560 [Exiguobacterium sp. SH5S4]